MLINIFLIVFIAGAVAFDYFCWKNLSTKDSVGVIKLRKKMRFDIILFTLFLAYAFYNGYTNHLYSTLTLSLTLTLILVVLKVTYFTPKILVFRKESLHFGMVSVPYGAILKVANEGIQIQLQVNGMKRPIKFLVADIGEVYAFLSNCEKLRISDVAAMFDKQRVNYIAAQSGGIYPLTGVIKDYDWGGYNFIPQVLGKKPQKTKAAEYWLGTHPLGLSTMSIPGRILKQLNETVKGDSKLENIETNRNYSVDLNTYLLHAQPVRSGEDASTAVKTDALPYLFKLLDVERPLSIQIHPDKATAERGYENEDLLKIDLKDPKRTFKDKNHKPELMVALGDFYLLHGFATKDKVLATLESRKATLGKFAEMVANTELGEVYKQVLKMDTPSFNELFGAHVDYCVSRFGKLVEHQLKMSNIQERVTFNGIDSHSAALDPDYWVAFSYISSSMSKDNLDVGLSCYYLFNLMHMSNMQGIFQGANVPHAYLRGHNIEVMAQSDNVVRGGLTPKYINKALLIELTDTTEIIPNVLTGEEYQVPVDDFTTVIKSFNTVGGSKATYEVRNASIVFVLEGNAQLELVDNPLNFPTQKANAGTAFFVSRNQQLEISGNATLVFASCK